MGLYISGSSLGGMGGRLLTGVLVDFVSWRTRSRRLGCLCLVAGLLFWRSLPPSARFRPRPAARGLPLARAVELFGDRGLPWLFAQGFLLMGSFVTVYNYVGFRLLAPPFGLSQTIVARSSSSISSAPSARPSSAAWPAASAAVASCGPRSS